MATTAPTEADQPPTKKQKTTTTNITLTISNLPTNKSVEQLSSIFQPFGPIQSFLLDPTNPAIGHLTFLSESSVPLALRLNGIDLGFGAPIGVHRHTTTATPTATTTTTTTTTTTATTTATTPVPIHATAFLARTNVATRMQSIRHQQQHLSTRQRHALSILHDRHQPPPQVPPPSTTRHHVLRHSIAATRHQSGGSIEGGAIEGGAIEGGVDPADLRAVMAQQRRRIQARRTRQHRKKGEWWSRALCVHCSLCNALCSLFNSWCSLFAAQSLFIHCSFTV
jgi:hypothetical protein